MQDARSAPANNWAGTINSLGWFKEKAFPLQKCPAGLFRLDFCEKDKSNIGSCSLDKGFKY